ncbi:MAG: hypothetical protein BMS9Abin39_0598 [Ignavibacteria bacterium]|nr:MAG: hypothetical protein BMS9Abin39_0598 [Ignavibacteria bacterium]
MNKSTFYIISFLIYSTTIFPQSYWEKTNGPQGGRMGAVVKGPEGNIISGTNEGRIFYSINNGKSWDRADTVFTGGVIDFVYCEDGSILAAIYDNKGVHGSTDGGKTWTINYLSTKKIYTIEKDTQGNIYAGTESLLGNIYKSTDNGNTWQSVHIVPQVSGYNRVNDIIYNTVTNTLFAGYNHYIYRSTDFGENWEFLSNGMGEADWIASITFDVNGYIYAGSAEVGGAIYLSTNNGDSWVNMDTSRTFGDVVNVNLYDILAVENYLLAATQAGVAKSTDMGKSWEFITEGLTSPVVLQFSYDSTSNTIYAANQRGGIFVSTDAGANWQIKSNGLNASTSLQISFDNDETLYVASFMNGVHRSTDYGENWELVVNGITTFTNESVLAAKDGYVITGTQDGYFVSTNRGDDWTKGTFYTTNTIFSIEEDLEGNWYFAIWGGPLGRSTDKGESWTNAISEFTYSLAVDSAGNIFAGTNSGRIYKSTDIGLNWFYSDNGLTTGSTIMDIVVSPTGRTMFAGTYGNGIFKSEDEGKNWINISQGGLEQKAVRGIGTRNDKEIFASIFREDEIYYSNNSGENWLLVSQGMYEVETKDFKVDRKGYVYAATRESVWKTKTNTIITDIKTEEDITPEKFYLSQNYPNPFNPVTIIKYEIPGQARNDITNVVLKVFDVLGKEITTLVNEEKPAGSYEVEFDGRGLPSGVYFYRLTAAAIGLAETKKMLLLK